LVDHPCIVAAHVLLRIHLPYGLDPRVHRRRSSDVSRTGIGTLAGQLSASPSQRFSARCCFPLKTVVAAGGGIIVGNFFRKIEIPYAQLASIDENWLNRGQYATTWLKEDSPSAGASGFSRTRDSHFGSGGIIQRSCCYENA
jgi:hypothetical protein